MKLADIRFVKLRHRAINVPARVMRGARTLEDAIVARGRGSPVDRELCPVLESVQREQLTLWAFVMIQIAVISKSRMAVAPGSVEVSPSEKLQQPSASPEDHHVSDQQRQHEVEFQTK